MVSMLPKRRAARQVVSIIAFAIAFAPAATCLAAVAAATPKMACHDSEEHSAGGSSFDRNCCPGDSTNSLAIDPSATAMTPLAHSPVLLAVLSFIVEPPAATPQAPVAHGPPGISTPPGVATYVFVSSFRI